MNRVAAVRTGKPCQAHNNIIPLTARTRAGECWSVRPPRSSVGGSQVASHAEALAEGASSGFTSYTS